MWRNVHLSVVATYWLQYFEFVINKYKANGIYTFVKIKQGTTVYIHTEAGHSSWWCNHRYTSPAFKPTSWIYFRFWTVIYTVWIPQCINSRRAHWTLWLDCGVIQLPHTFPLLCKGLRCHSDEGYTVIWDMMAHVLVGKHCFEEPAASIIMAEDFNSHCCQHLTYQCCNI
jgi:hypothetical protein